MTSQLVFSGLSSTPINHLRGLSLTRNSLVRITDRPETTEAVNCGRKKQNARISAVF